MENPSTSRSTPKKSVTKKVIKRQAREIIFRVHEYLVKNKKDYNLNYNVMNSVCEITGYSRSSISNIVKEGRKMLQEDGELKFSTPKSRGKSKNPKVIIDSFSESLIRRKIHHFYVIKKQCPTIKKLLLSLKFDGEVDCSREYLRRKLKTMGYKWKKCQSNRKILCEKQEIAAWRIRYLREIRNFRKANRCIIYLDETYLHATHTVQTCWQSPDEMGATANISKGPRLIIVHAGGECGFIPSALLIFKSKVKNQDYHGDMNTENFLKWFKEKLIPNLPPNSVIVMDNASYHCKVKNKKPNSANLKREILEWLVEQGIPHNSDMRKPELLNLCKDYYIKKIYIVEEILNELGHDLLYLPPYHPELNPIELVWGDIKNKIASECLSTSLNEKRSYCESVFNSFSVEKWKACCEHVKKVEVDYWEKDFIIDEEMDKIIVNLGGSSSSSSENDRISDESDSD